MPITHAQPGKSISDWVLQNNHSTVKWGLGLCRQTPQWPHPIVLWSSQHPPPKKKKKTVIDLKALPSNWWWPEVPNSSTVEVAKLWNLSQVGKERVLGYLCIRKDPFPSHCSLWKVQVSARFFPAEQWACFKEDVSSVVRIELTSYVPGSSQPSTQKNGYSDTMPCIRRQFWARNQLKL